MWGTLVHTMELVFNIIASHPPSRGSHKKLIIVRFVREVILVCEFEMLALELCEL